MLMPKGGSLVSAWAWCLGIGASLGVASYSAPLRAASCDDSCDAACTACCSVWQVSALCGSRVLVDSAFARYGIAERVARSLNEQAASCEPSTGACEGARIACPGSSAVAVWKATCEPEARNEGPNLTSPWRAALVQADRLRRAEVVAIPGAVALLEDLRARPDAKKQAQKKAVELEKDLEKARTQLAEHDAALAAALSSPPAKEEAERLLKKLGTATERVADRVSRALALGKASESVDPGAAGKREKAEQEAREKADRKAREDETRAVRAAEKAARAEQEKADRQARAERERAEKDARAATAAADHAEKEHLAAEASAAADADAALAAKEMRTDALSAVARASSQADATLLSAVKLLSSDLDKSEKDTVTDARKRLEGTKEKLGAAFALLKATESEPSGTKQRDAVRKLQAHVAELSREVDSQGQRLKELIQRRAARR